MTVSTVLVDSLHQRSYHQVGDVGDGRESWSPDPDDRHRTDRPRRFLIVSQFHHV